MTKDAQIIETDSILLETVTYLSPVEVLDTGYRCGEST